MQGVYIDTDGTGDYDRPATKKALREALAANPGAVAVEATSWFGNEYDGPASEMPEGVPVYVVGPDPHRRRNWYAVLTRKGGTVAVK